MLSQQSTVCTVVQAVSCMAVQAVIKANSQSNEMAKFTPRGFKTPEQILVKLRIYNYVVGMTTHANLCDTVSTLVLSANTRFVTCCSFLVYLSSFFTLFFSSRPAGSSGQILKINTSYDVFPHKEVPFRAQNNTAPHLGSQIPPKKQLWGINKRFQA